MNLKNKIENTLCYFKNDKYNISSPKLKKISFEFLNDIIKETFFLDEYTPTITDRIKYILKEKNTINKCSNCQKPILNLNLKYCSAKCNNNSEETKNKFRQAYSQLSEKEKQERNSKRTQTVNDKYGGYTLQSDELKNKMRNTMINRYGVEHSFQNYDSKQKAINLWLSKYGVDNPFKSNEIKCKIRDVLIERYGVDSPCFIDSDERIKKTMITKINNGWVIPDEFLSEYQIYRKSVRRITEKNYKKYIDIINPYKLERVTNGKNGYQLDHKYSILEGFLNNVDVYIISHQCNLQMLKCKQNRNKSKKCSIELEQLIKDIKINESKYK